MIVDQETTIRESAPRLLRFCRARVGNIGPGVEITRESPAALIMHWRPNSPFHGAKGFPPWRKRKRKALLFPGALLQERTNRVSYGTLGNCLHGILPPAELPLKIGARARGRGFKALVDLLVSQPTLLSQCPQSQHCQDDAGKQDAHRAHCQKPVARLQLEVKPDGADIGSTLESTVYSVH